MSEMEEMMMWQDLIG